jgi:hypothetical protein
MNDWAASLGLTRTAFPDTNDRLERGGELLSKKGITCDKWQDVAELLAMANFTNLPIPTINAAVVNAWDVAMDDDTSMDFEDEQDTIDYQIRTFRALKRSPLSTQEELHLVEMLFDLVLLDGRVRQQIMDATKHLKAMKDFKLALDLQRRQLHLNEKLTITTLMNHTDSDSGSDMQATSDRLDKEELDALVATIRSDKRLSRLTTPWDENEYWLFHDLLSPQQHMDGIDKQHSRESYWAHGVIMIGRCPTREDDSGETQDKQQQQQRAWWYLEGVEDMRKLAKWLTASLSIQKTKGAIDKDALDIAENDIKLFQIHLGRRMEYLGLLDRVAY